MIIEARFQHFSSRVYKDKTYCTLDCYDEVAGCPIVMSIDDEKKISDVFSVLKFGDPIACSVRLYEVERGKYRLICYDVDTN